MSGILGQLLGSVMGGQQAGQPNAIAGILQQVIASNGGVSGVISRFQGAGLGDRVQSWVGTGQNMPVSADQVGQAFPDSQLQQWADQAGTTPDKMKAVLAEALPHAIDHATPGGEVPPPGTTPDLSGLVGRLFGGTSH